MTDYTFSVSRMGRLVFVTLKYPDRYAAEVALKTMRGLLDANDQLTIKLTRVPRDTPDRIAAALDAWFADVPGNVWRDDDNPDKPNVEASMRDRMARVLAATNIQGKTP